MKIYFAGTMGAFKLNSPNNRERKWLKFINKRLLSYYDIVREDTKGSGVSFLVIKEINENQDK